MVNICNAVKNNCNLTDNACQIDIKYKAKAEQF